jgi:hypothetical protein
MKRTVMTISLSPLNVDAVLIVEALKDVPPGERSATLVRWAAAYLTRRHEEPPEQVNALGLTEAEIDELFDAF